MQWRDMARERYVSTHSRPKAAAVIMQNIRQKSEVSTHSRPKAAASYWQIYPLFAKCFNTQPPEGGCIYSITIYI